MARKSLKPAFKTKVAAGWFCMSIMLAIVVLLLLAAYDRMYLMRPDVYGPVARRLAVYAQSTPNGNITSGRSLDANAMPRELEQFGFVSGNADLGGTDISFGHGGLLEYRYEVTLIYDDNLTPSDTTRYNVQLDTPFGSILLQPIAVQSALRMSQSEYLQQLLAHSDTLIRTI